MSSPRQLLPVPFVLSTHGRAEIPHPAERAVIHVAVASQGSNKASVSDEVVTTAQHIEKLLRELSPSDTTSEAKAAAPLAHWSKTGLSATSFIPYTHHSSMSRETRQYSARLTFDIRFQKFKELGGFATKLSALPHAEISHIDWILTVTSRKAYQGQLRQAATRDALAKAQDYCAVLGCTNLRPVELSEANSSVSGGSSSLFANSSHGGFGGGLFGSSKGGQQQQAYPQMQSAPGNQQGNVVGTDSRDESPLEFTPKEVRLSMDVSVKFHADPGTLDRASPSSSSVSLAKRPRVETTETMEE